MGKSVNRSDRKLDKVKEYKSGKDKLFGFFVGQVMKVSKGKGNPQMINKILKGTERINLNSWAKCN